MAKRAASKKKKTSIPAGRRFKRRIMGYVLKAVLGIVAALVVGILLFAVLNPPTTPYMFSESRRLGGVDHQWVPLEDIAPVMARSVVAAEDANFCNHWGFDLAAIKNAIAQGSNRGASTLSQQTVKNVYLWHGRTWIRKALEAAITPVLEAIWTKRRIVEVYLNVAEFDEGVFGVDAAAHHYFGVIPADLTATQAARLAAILPSPKTRSASRPSAKLRKRSAQIRDGAATISKDGRASCFES
ncbi:monofunctional biosynthetic peptidoglycan transglycosylase [Sulfitobacter sp.]|uniref:monofunctional biosynthetic peptidoglycan transglycosylase n=1 Tax=Sulfitobacter sp. TaxID=1903071 RepID=UPI00356205E3|tara:strand:- start:2102 stop:2827 length:726 start_codon:yes stop_codon:yes gene_type:complete